MVDSVKPTPWAELANELRAVRNMMRNERKLHGRVLPETALRFVEAMARAETFIVIDDAKATTEPA